MQSLTHITQQLDRRIKIVIRQVDTETLSRQERHDVSQLKRALQEIRLDVRDYEYAQTREEQLKWAKLARHNLGALNTLLLRLDTVFGPVDVAELGATIETLQTALE